MHKALKSIRLLAGGAILLMASACNGVFDDIYDTPSNATNVMQGQLFVNATSWKDWYYVDFDSLQQYVERKDTAGLQRAQTVFTAYPIPTTGASSDGKTGLYSYWFDVFGEGISKYERRGYTPTGAQPEPASWSLAFHRNNVRTNGGAVLETRYTSLDELPKNSSEFTGAVFTGDEWSESEVWADQSQMLSGIIGCQGITINKVLSSWLRINIPPMPPQFTLNSHVFIIRLKNGKYAAAQLKNYMDTSGTKCWLTINYKYPY